MQNKCLTLLILLFCLSTSCKNDEKNNAEFILKEGNKLFNSINCIQCHSLEGEKLYGPPLNSILEKTITVERADNKIINLVVNRDYIYRGIKNPNFEKATEYSKSIMPVPQISEEQINILTDYIVLINKKVE
ncbi:MAG: c-type cytochrome [Jejuia sp.]